MHATDDRLIYQVFTAQNVLRTHIRNRLRASGVRITLVQSGILFLLSEQSGRTMSELSRALLLDNSTVTSLVDLLEKSGFVERRTNPEDRRVSLVRITPSGIEEAKKAQAIINRINREIKEGFSVVEVESFSRVLRSLIDRFRKQSA